MYEPQVYGNMTDDQIYDSIKSLGFDPLLIADPPGRIYPPHTHPETKVLAFLKGDMVIEVDGQMYHCFMGDKIVIEGNKEHSARVGDQGCSFYWAEKLV